MIRYERCCELKIMAKLNPKPKTTLMLHRMNQSLLKKSNTPFSSLAASLVYALHVYLCFFHADFVD